MPQDIRAKEPQVFSKWRASLEHAHYLDKKWYPDSLKLAGRLLLTILLVSWVALGIKGRSLSQRSRRPKA